MISSDKRRSFTSEIADETTKKNGFEERRLRSRLKDIEQHALKQRKKRNNEQLEYALENLSLEDMDSFNNLTRKILESNFLPPINRSSRGSNSEDKRENRDDLLVERLRGSKMIQKYLKSRKSRKLTRSLSVDSGIIPNSANGRKETEQKPGPYSSFVLKRRLVESFSDAPRRPMPDAGVKAKASRFDAAKGSSCRVHFVDSQNENGKTRSKYATEKEASPGQVRPQQRKVQHECLSEAIEYKLKMREIERKKSLQVFREVKDK